MALELGINSVDLAGLAAGTRYKMLRFRDFVSQNQKTPLGFNETTLFHVLNLADTSHYRRTTFSELLEYHLGDRQSLNAFTINTKESCCCTLKLHNMYLLTEWEGRMGKYLARGQDVRTERSEVRAS